MVSPGELKIVALNPPLALGVRLMENWVNTVSLSVTGLTALLSKRVVKLFVKVSVAVLALTMDICHAPLTPSIRSTVITSAQAVEVRTATARKLIAPAKRLFHFLFIRFSPLGKAIGAV